MHDHFNQESTAPALKWIVLAFLLVLLLKFSLAAALDLYSDEIFYWLASNHPALAYSDLPFMTALLAGAVSSLLPGEAFFVRLPFLLLGSCIPLLVYWLARPLTNHRMALESAGLALCLPLGGFLGLLAVPDVPLIVFGLLAIGSFERALRRNHWRFWLATGVVTALGLSTHYRFLLYPAAAILFLICFPGAREQWRNPRFWVTIGIASIGLIPVLWFNLSNQLSSASFYLVERHPWQFQPAGLLHVFKQAGLVTPPLYAALVFTAWQLWRRTRNGERGPALLLAFALVNINVYLVLAPWSDADSTSIHWPLSGYFPLLVYLPEALRSLWQWFAERWTKTIADRIIFAIPCIGFIGTLLALLGVGSQAFQQSLQMLIGTGVLSNKMAGWQQFTRHTENLLASSFAANDPVIITDNYYTAAQLEFAGLTSHAYTLDQDKAVRDGRITQLRLWGKDGSALPANDISNGLFISEDSTITVGEKAEIIDRLCHRAQHIIALDTLNLFAGDKTFSFYQFQGLDNPPREAPASPCPRPMRAWLDLPVEHAEVSGQFVIAGWAISEEVGVASVSVLLDGELVQETEYGNPRPDVVNAESAQADPNAPNLGFHTELDSRQYSNGSYDMTIVVRNNQGAVYRLPVRTISIAN